MKLRILPVLTVMATLGLVNPAQAENLEHIQRLMSSRQCQQCDLTRAGLVFSNLAGSGNQEHSQFPKPLRRSL